MKNTKIKARLVWIKLNIKRSKILDMSVGIAVYHALHYANGIDVTREEE